MLSVEKFNRKHENFVFNFHNFSPVELGFIVTQYYIYPFHFRVPEMWECTHFGRPCLNRHTSCYIARPMEKTVFIAIMYGTSVFMILLSVYELYRESTYNRNVHSLHYVTKSYITLKLNLIFDLIVCFFLKFISLFRR